MAFILSGNNYPYKFITPRKGTNQIIRTKFLSNLLRHLWRPLEAFAVWLPVSLRYDLIHSFNGIVITRKPWIVTYESMCPRTIGLHEFTLRKLLRRRLLCHNCKAIIAMSDYARHRFILQNSDWEGLKAALEKTMIMYPGIALRTRAPKVYRPEEKLRLIFIGNHFAQKGGVVALRVIKKAAALGLPVELHVVSGLVIGKKVYADDDDISKYDKDLKLLQHPNVVFHGKVPNDEVIELLSYCHFHILPTLDDTFGFSVIESFSVGTPVITTNVCALPELVKDGINGYLLSLDLDAGRKWVQLGNRKTKGYWALLDRTYENLADQAIGIISGFLKNSSSYSELSRGALDQAAKNHDGAKMGQLLDELYVSSINKDEQVQK